MTIMIFLFLGGTLAHAFYPTSGVVHFDEDETWSLTAEHGRHLLVTATHEFGHTLGIYEPITRLYCWSIP